MAPPINPVPDPRGTIGTRAPAAQLTTACTCSASQRQHDGVGRPLVEGVHVALVGHAPFQC